MRWALLFVGLIALASGPAAAFNLRVVAATELRLEPRVTPDGRLTVAAHLRNDQLAPVRHATVVVRTNGVETSITTDDNGDGEATLRLAGDPLAVNVDGSYEGDGQTAPARTSIRVNLAAPFVTADLTMPPVVEIESPDARITAVVTVRTGESRLLPSLRLSVDVTADERQLVAGQTDASGRAVFEIPVREFGGIGIRRLRPHVSILSDAVAGAERNIIVRARTTVSLARVPGTDGPTLVGVLSTRTGPVAGEPLRIVRGAMTLGGVTTDAHGEFSFHPVGMAAHVPGAAVTAVFDPTEPWFLGCVSAPVELAVPEAPTVAWMWEIAPLALAAFVLLAARQWAVRPSRQLTVLPVIPHAPGATRVEAIQSDLPGGLRIRLSVTDVSTGQPIRRVSLRLSRGEAWREADGPMDLPSIRRLKVDVAAAGYSPRIVDAEFPRPGEYVLHVALRNWREELFDRVRSIVLPRGRRAVGQTPREVFEAIRGSGGEHIGTLVELVEEGCYGPIEPNVDEIQRADAIVTVVRAGGDGAIARGER